MRRQAESTGFVQGASFVGAILLVLSMMMLGVSFFQLRAEDPGIVSQSPKCLPNLPLFTCYDLILMTGRSFSHLVPLKLTSLV